MLFAKEYSYFRLYNGFLGSLRGAMHWAGGFAGWTIAAGSAVDYKKWATTRNVHVGDVVVLKFNNKFHDVVRVTQQKFKSCNATSPIAVYSSGSDNIELIRPGHFYFICSFPGHCQSGQKDHIEVTQAEEYLSSLASSVFDRIPQSDEALASLLASSPESMEPIPGPAQSNAPSLNSFNFWLALAVLVIGFGVNGIFK